MVMIRVAFIVLFTMGFLRSSANSVTDTVVNIVKEYYTNTKRLHDTLVIKHGLKLDLGTVYLYTKIITQENIVRIQNYTEQLHFEKITPNTSKEVQKLILDSECEMQLSVFANELEAEEQRCKNRENRFDDRWTYQFTSKDSAGIIIKDEFGYCLFYFFNNMLCKSK